MNFLPKARSKELIIKQQNDETLVYDLSSNKAFCLNKTSKLVWQLSTGKRSIAEISNEMSKKMETLISEDLVWFAIDQLKNDGLLENNDNNLSLPFEGLSRREVIRKVGFASLVALPLVSSIIAPQSAMAQSCAPFNGACANSPQCCSNNCSLFTNLCCANGTTNVTSTGTTFCVNAGNQGFCDSECCSGSGTLGAMGMCAVGEEECTCN